MTSEALCEPCLRPHRLRDARQASRSGSGSDLSALGTCPFRTKIPDHSRAYLLLFCPLRPAVAIVTREGRDPQGLGRAAGWPRGRARPEPFSAKGRPKPTDSFGTIRSRNVTEGPGNPPSHLAHLSGSLIPGTLSRLVQVSVTMTLAITRSFRPQGLHSATLSYTTFTAKHPSQNEMPTPLLNAGHSHIALPVASLWSVS